MSDNNKSSVEDEMLMALADGELDSEQAETLRTRIDRDPDLAARYAIFRETADAMRAAYSTEEVPERLIKVALTAPTDLDGAETARGDTVVPLLQRAAWPMALAASLVIGVGFGWVLSDRSDVPTAGVGLSDIAEAVGQVPTGQPFDLDGFGTVRVLGSFETNQGLCRLIAVDPVHDVPGRFVACKEGSQWHVSLSVSQGQSEGFTPASEAANELIDLYLDAIGAGPALDARTEAESLE